MVSLLTFAFERLIQLIEQREAFLGGAVRHADRYAVVEVYLMP